MRVAMVVYAFYESDTRVMMYANALRARGDEVEVVALRQSNQTREGVINGVKVNRIQERTYREKGKFSYLWRIMLFFVRSFLFLWERHRHEPFDLIHVHSVPDFEVFAAWYPKWKGAKLILDIHDIVPEFYASKFHAPRESFLYRVLVFIERVSIAFSDHVIISNAIWREKLLRRAVSEEKCTSIINYPDQSIFSARPRPSSNGKFLIVYPGTLNWHQGIDIAVRAFNRIKNDAPHAEFRIYGIGGAKDSLQQLIKELGLEERVKLLGWVPTSRVAEVMAEADLGVVPKRNDPFGGEAFSTKTLEFMSLGIPIIVSATKIDKYYFNDDVVQFFEPENEEDLAEKMLCLATDEEKRKRLVAKATEFIKEYSWDNKKHLYLELVDSLVGRN